MSRVCFFLLLCLSAVCSFFFFNDTATTEIYTLSLHDALPISGIDVERIRKRKFSVALDAVRGAGGPAMRALLERFGCMVTRSEEHTSELQSRLHLVCRLLLEKKKKNGRETYGAAVQRNANAST